MGSLYSCEEKISENKTSFVLLKHIRSQISLTLVSSLKLANNRSADFVVQQNEQLFMVFRKVHIGIGKICLPKKSIITKKCFKCVSFQTFMWLHDHNILKLWYYMGGISQDVKRLKMWDFYPLFFGFS